MIFYLESEYIYACCAKLCLLFTELLSSPSRALPVSFYLM